MTGRVLAFVLLLCSLPWAAGAPAQPFQTLRLTHAEFVTGEGLVPPATGWAPVELPEVFSRHPQTGMRTVWLRLSFELPAPPDEPLVLLVQRLVTTVEFRLNGSLLNPGVHFEQPGGPAGTAMLNWPHWMVLPPGLFKAGRNELLVTLRGDRIAPPWISGLSIGTAAALRGEYLLRDVPQRLVPQALFVLLLATLVFSLRLWWRERQPLQGLVVTTAVLWLLQLAIYLDIFAPLPWRIAVALIAAVWIAFHWALLQLLWRLTDGGWAWFPRALQVGSALPLAGAALVLAVEPTESVLGLLMLPTTVLRFITTAMLLRWAWRTRTASALLLTGCELLWFAGPVQLMLVVMDVLPPDPFMLDPGSALPMALVLVGLAAQRLAVQREQAMLQRQAAVIEERQRMMLDMHDGIGSQLVTALRLARRDEVPRLQVAQVIQDALTDLRLIIDAQDGAAQELQSLMQQWRERTEPRLQAQGLHVQWALQALPAPRPLSAPEALQILRILQEAVSNAVQHGRPTTLTISLAPMPGGGCELSVADDGVGLGAPPPAGQRRGHGLAGMQQRAARLGATLSVRPGSERGTVVSLLLPADT